MHHAPSRSVRHCAGAFALAALVVAFAISETAHAALTADGLTASSIGHLVISEVMTGGAGASDEFVELYNPASVSLSLDGLELVYVTASGATVTRKAVWGPGVEIGPGGHVLVANESGVFAGIADGTYAGGLAATGGSMALRVVAAAHAIDAVGWGTATSSWLEGSPAPAAPAGSSLERLPGGALGSGQDTDGNLVDFVVRPAPDPQNSTSPPVPTGSPSPDPSASEPPSDSASPSASGDPSVTPEPTTTPEPSSEPSFTPDPTAAPSTTPTPTPAATPAPTPGPAPLTVVQARALPDGSAVVVRGTTLTDSAFAEGGGYLADGSGGIAVLLDDGTFPRGVELVVSGTVDDRFAQRTVRADAAGLTILGPGQDLEADPVDTGAVGENVEGRLVTVSGLVAGSPTELAAGLAFEVDDGSGPIRVLVGPTTGIDASSWQGGSSLTVTGVVGQRDSSGTGAEGYRVQPRDSGDVLAVAPRNARGHAEPVARRIVECDANSLARRRAPGDDRRSPGGRDRVKPPDPRRGHAPNGSGGGGERRRGRRRQRHPCPDRLGAWSAATGPAGRADRHAFHALGDAQPARLAASDRSGYAGRARGRPAGQRRNRRGGRGHPGRGPRSRRRWSPAHDGRQPDAHGQ